ncbi:glycosyl hydrolase [Haloferula sp. A504]|uniref:glycosyl hydrolase n=1 Tax=Haloferula sp. A504 TaxID=3373601 RepID=UPI0031C5A791|nr:hypothetical protein [Verrucomicrobiaceae bacterium E54]
MKFFLVHLLAAALAFPAAASDLEAGFRNPPDSARPHTWWHWMNGNVSREGITTDLEAMEQAGIGGAMIFFLAGPHHNCDTPRGAVDYLGPAWLEMMKHAADECQRLGLEFGMHNCAGWCTTGGPWITPELAMQKLVSSEIVVEGGRTISEKLPQPEVALGHYRDIAVYAVPAELDTGFRMPKWQSKSGQRGGPAGRQPALNPLPQGAAIPADRIINVTGRFERSGTLTWRAPAGRWKIIRLGHTPTGMTNKPAPDYVTGLEVDKLRREGLEVHWKHGIQPLLDHLGPHVGKAFKHLTIDSYEAGLHHWTPRMKEEFEKRRGYDPSPYLLALTGRAITDGPTTERFYWDFRRTIADLFAENYYGHMAQLCHEHGLLFTTEPYTSCFEGLQIGGKADIPMAEFWSNGKYSFSMRLAASAAHTHGRRIAAAEAFTAGPDIGKWTNHPGSMKTVGDRAWAAGINRFVFHRYAHQPWDDVVPGMTMGQYGIHFERTTTWWEPGRAWLDYIRRSQFLLQDGEFGADVLVFAGNAMPNGAAHREDLSAAGYGYDSCGTDIFAGLTVDDGDVVVPCGKRYRLLVLPNHSFHTPAQARKLRELVRAGATVHGPKPQHTPSNGNFPASEQELAAIGDEVWGKCDGTTVASNRFGKGRVFSGISVVETLAEMGIAPALELPGETPVEWIHRRHDGADSFFVSNPSESTMSLVAGFRAPGRRPEFWDAETATLRPAAGWSAGEDHVRVPLQLAPGKSVFVVFREPYPATLDSDPVVRATDPAKDSLIPFGDETGEVSLRAWHNGRHALHRASGKTVPLEVTGLPAPLALDGAWTVRFPPGRGAVDEAVFDPLVAWNEHPNPGIRHFSGTATYKCRFQLPDGFRAGDGEVWLDLGEVEVIAEVRLNGKELGVLWHPPFRVEVSGALQSGDNTLEVEVTNLWINRLIGDEQHPDDCEWDGKALARWPDWFVEGRPRPSKERVTFTTWKHWTAADPLQPSGLIGPVTLRPARLVPLP